MGERGEKMIDKIFKIGLLAVLLFGFFYIGSIFRYEVCMAGSGGSGGSHDVEGSTGDIKWIILDKWTGQAMETFATIIDFQKKEVTTSLGMGWKVKVGDKTK